MTDQTPKRAASVKTFQKQMERHRKDIEQKRVDLMALKREVDDAIADLNEQLEKLLAFAHTLE